MPANLTPQYLEAEKRYKDARVPDEKLKALREMLAIIPKHKGTEKLQADLRRRLSKVQEEVEAARHRKGGGRPSPGYVKKEGAGQIVLVGAPNSGKSSLLDALSNARPKIASFPFSTHEPVAGMVVFEDVQVQLVDAPPVATDYLETWLGELLRNADRALLVVDLGSDALLDDLDAVVRGLAECQVRLRALGSPASADERTASIETVVVANKADEEGAETRLLLLREALPSILGPPEDEVRVTSVATGRGVQDLRRVLFECLRVIRLYTKMPGQKPDRERPFVLPRQATVLDLARVIHGDVAGSLQYAKLWGSSRFEGQTVQRDQVLQDGDIVEIHT